MKLTVEFEYRAYPCVTRGDSPLASNYTQELYEGAIK